MVIYDARYGNVVDRGRNVLHRLYLGANEILQMAGRVHGRVPNGEVDDPQRPRVSTSGHSVPPLQNSSLPGTPSGWPLPAPPSGVDARDLDLPVPLDRSRVSDGRWSCSPPVGLVENGRLTSYGREVEALPVERSWGELLVMPGQLVPMVAVCSTFDSLYRMTREERDLHGVLVNGSDHLTTYNLYAEAVNQHGYVGEVYGLPRHLFEDGLEEWAERRGVLVKAIEDAALGVASVYRSLELPLPKQLPYANRDIRRDWADLLARIMPFDLVIDEHTADGQVARVSKTSVAGSWGAVAGTLRYFADRFGVPRASVEGTTLSYDLIRTYARLSQPRMVLLGPRKHQQLALERRRTFFGFELETQTEPLEGPIPAELRPAARDTLTDSIQNDETSHPDQSRLRRSMAELDELWRRSGGTVPAIAPENLRARIREQLESATSWDDFLATRIELKPETLIDEATRHRLEALPGSVHLKGDTVPLEYEIQNGEGVARLRLRQGQAKRLRPNEVPRLDRPLRFAVQRGRHPPIQADTLPALQALVRNEGSMREEEHLGREHPHKKGREHRRDRGRGRNRTGDRGRRRR